MVRLLFYFVDFLFAVLAWRALGRVFQSLFGPHGANPFSSSARNPRHGAGSPRVVSGQTARDPVCGMFVSTELSHRLERGGKTLHFCSRECLERYGKEGLRA
jgi:YHS domain-containing protein